MLRQSLGGPGGDAYPPHGRDMHNDELRRIGMRALRGIPDLRAEVDGQTAAQAVFGDRASNVLDALAIAQADGPAQGKSRADHVIP